MPYHKNIIVSEIHAPFGLGPYADATARTGAVGLVSADLGKFARQLDDDSVWMLTEVTPTWALIATPAIAFVPDSRQVNAGAGLVGGGNLSADRTFDIANVDGSITVNANDIQVGVLATDAQHGLRGGGTQHADATTSVAGFLSAADKTKIDNPPTDTLFWGNTGIGTSTTARFLTPGHDPNTALTTAIQFRVPRVGVLKQLRVHSNTAGTGAATLTFTVRKNSVATTITCSYSNTAQDGSDVTNSISVAAGDLIDITITKSTTLSSSPAEVMATLEYAV